MDTFDKMPFEMPELEVVTMNQEGPTFSFITETTVFADVDADLAYDLDTTDDLDDLDDDDSLDTTDDYLDDGNDGGWGALADIGKATLFGPGSGGGGGGG